MLLWLASFAELLANIMAEFIGQLTYQGTAHAPDAPALLVEGVSFRYGHDITAVSALQNVSFRIEKGEQIAVVGPNGAGKSTLFKLIVGTLQPTHGRLLMHGHIPNQHICIAYVPQRSQIDWNFPVTVAEVVMMGRVGKVGLFRRPGRADWTYVRDSLERVNGLHLANKQIGALSGGQQQRVFIARALAQEAELLLLDEPLAGLDVPSQEAIFEILDGLRPHGVTVLVATHDLTTAAARFDRVMLLNRRLVAFDVGAAVLTKDNLLAAYGSHMHRVGAEVVLTDGCCDE